MEEKFKVLMIDDETDIVGFLTATFKNFKSIEFFTALRAAHGIDIAKKEMPQLVMLDLRMPGMNGEEALAELKKILPNAKFIIMTGWDDEFTEARIQQLGVDAYLTKPIDLEKLITKVMNLLMIKKKGESW